jgi:hypothetical protein
MELQKKVLRNQLKYVLLSLKSFQIEPRAKIQIYLQQKSGSLLNLNCNAFNATIDLNFASMRP